MARLRAYHPPTCAPCDTWGGCGYGEPCDCTCHQSPHHEAADTIERLQCDLDDSDEENARLRGEVARLTHLLLEGDGESQMSRPDPHPHSVHGLFCSCLGHASECCVPSCICHAEADTIPTKALGPEAGTQEGAHV